MNTLINKLLSVIVFCVLLSGCVSTVSQVNRLQNKVHRAALDCKNNNSLCKEASGCSTTATAAITAILAAKKKQAVGEVGVDLEAEAAGRLALANTACERW